MQGACPRAAPSHACWQGSSARLQAPACLPAHLQGDAAELCRDVLDTLTALVAGSLVNRRALA